MFKVLIKKLDDILCVLNSIDVRLAQQNNVAYPAAGIPNVPDTNQNSEDGITCSRCGLLLQGSANYTCNYHPCPIGLGQVAC